MADNKPKVALITGQDGDYLAEFLLKKGYEVHGIKRRTSIAFAPIHVKANAGHFLSSAIAIHICASRNSLRHICKRHSSMLA